MAERKPKSGIASKLKAIFELTRFEHLVMYAVTILIGVVLVTWVDASLTTLALLAVVTALFIEMGASYFFSLNKL